MTAGRRCNAQQEGEFGVSVGDVGFLVGEGANYVAQRGEGGVDVAGLLEGVAIGAGERLALAAGEVDEMELRFACDGDGLLYLLR